MSCPAQLSAKAGGVLELKKNHYKGKKMNVMSQTGVQKRRRLAPSQAKEIASDLSVSDLWRSLLLVAEQSGISYHLSEFALGTPLVLPATNNGFHSAAQKTFQPVASDGLEEGFSQDGSQTQANSDLYLICQGRVRLLCTPFGQTRAVTALLLGTGETFGAETQLGSQPLAYRAIAASEVQIARFSQQSLQALLDRFPGWRVWLERQAQQQEYMVFLRSCAEGRSLPSRLLQPLASVLTVHSIPAGTSLVQTTMPPEGRCWLQRGTIRTGQSETEQGRSLPIGTSWGYPEGVPDDWVAQTELRVYHLAADHWENLILLNRLALSPKAASAVPEPNVAAKTAPQPPTAASSPPERHKTSRPASPPTVSQPRSAGSPPPAPATEPSQVTFPKPVRRHLMDWFGQFPWLEQHSSSDCGAACLAMICHYWGKRLPLHFLRERANVGRSGASLTSLAKAAESIGFHARPVRASLSRLVSQTSPWIAHWEGNHYVVVYQIKGNRVWMANPAQGRRSISRKEFQKHWSGYALLLDPTEGLKETQVKEASLGRYLRALAPYRGLSIQIILVSLLIQLFSLVTPLFTQIILDQVVVQKSQSTLNVFAIGLVLFGVWGLCMGSVRQYLLSYFANRLDLTLLSGFIRYALTLPLHFFESRRVGDILTRVQENHKIQRFLIGQILLAWLDFLTGFVYLGLMLYYNWRLTLLVLGLIPPIAILTLVATPFLRRISRQIFNEAAEQNSALVEMMTGIATLKAAAAERELRWRWEDHLTSQLNATFRGQKLGIGLQFTSGLINSLGGAALLWYGATLVIQDQLTIGQFVAFNMMMGYVIRPVITLVNLWDELQEVMISVERLNDVFETQPEESPQQSLMVLPPLVGTVRFENVTFRYGEDEERNTLQNLSLEVQPGETIAIVGRSGSGKTTLVKLLEGLYFANQGRVYIDGHDLRHVALHSLRSQMGVVPQECFLFSGTILENITLYRSDYSLEQVIEVAKLAEAHAFIQSLPLGYNTIVGERGATLSGGQRQRIAIARALLGYPRILVLDEATSSLDTESERRFQRNLAQISRDRTTFLIAHRLSTVRNADRILVLDRGVLVEQGTHEELLALQGLYAHLAQQQLDL